MDIHSCYKIGYVAKTHGLKGEVTVILDGAVSSFQKNNPVFVEINDALVPYFIEHVSDRGDRAFVKFEGVDTPEDAARLKGRTLFLSKKTRPVLDRDAFYDDEVIGFEVEDQKLGTLGKIREVLQIGPNRLIAIDRASGEILIPVNGPFIQSLNKSRKKFRVELPEGFLDI